MTDLATWLLACIAEDEAEADDLHDRKVCDQYSYDPRCCDCGMPTRVLAECAAKRAIVEWAQAFEMTIFGGATWNPNETVLCLLALPYADRPGYRQEWAP